MQLSSLLILKQITAEFDESQHPRDKSGKFAHDADTILHEKTGGQAGSNQGGFYKGKDGIDRYVKFYQNPGQGRGEALANSIYRDLGIGAPKSTIFENKNGKEAFASEIIPGGKTLQQEGLTKENANAILKGYAADVLTSNWDVIGLVNDNIKMIGGEAHRIDNGAAFLYRAQGGVKPEALLNKTTEFDGFNNPQINREYARVIAKAGYSSPDQIPGIKGQVEKIVALQKSSGGWDKYVSDKAPFLDTHEHSKMVSMLDSRTKLLAERVGIKS